MMRFLIDCTFVYNHPELNSGIQRVVRNVIHNLPQRKQKEVCIPIIFDKGNMFAVNRFRPEKIDEWAANLENWADKSQSHYWTWYIALYEKQPISSSRILRRLLKIGFHFFHPFYLPIIRLLTAAKPIWFGRDQIEPLDVKKDDVLILLDSSWHNDFFDAVKQLKQRGVKVIGVVYDLIPLTHPQFCDEGLVKQFETWFQWIIRLADGFMCISKSTAGQVRRFLADRLDGAEDHVQWTDHFYLGSELDQEAVDQRILQRVKEVFSSGRPVYLMVSTIEPRKNHATLLNVFDRLWSQDWDLSLCIVGEVGWKCDALIRRIETHPEKDRRLFMLNGLSDYELAFCYRESKALVFPSFVEGFGLPLIEALDRGLPVIASDIPVFREVVGSFATYFDPNDSESLYDAVKGFESGGAASAKARLNSWHWITWRDATVQLLDGVKRHVYKRERPWDGTA